jgi:superoxide dismutase, Fe-Mn family
VYKINNNYLLINMPFELPKLPYEYDSLEPYIDRGTMNLHHTKHHQAYIDKLNTALTNYSDLQKFSVEDLLKNIKKVPEVVKQEVINNGGGHTNHSFFWNIMAPGMQEPDASLKNMLSKDFGSFNAFKEEFTKKAMGVFGSGWTFLVVGSDKKLNLTRNSFQNSPLLKGEQPILGIDLWEHAYYLKYQNRRLDYINAWWNVVNWGEVNNNLQKALRNLD